MKYSLIIIISLFILTSCRGSKDIFGTYISNFAVNGYHIRQIKLKSDSTLEYRYWGHMIFDTATAHFTRNYNTLILNYYPIKVDTSDWPVLHKQGFTLMEQEYARLGKSAPYALIIKNRKLFLIDSDKKIVKSKIDVKGRSKSYFLKKAD